MTGCIALSRRLNEARRKDPYSKDFLESLEDMLPALAPVFDRAPKYAWIAKQLLEPERVIQFRVVRTALFFRKRTMLIYDRSYPSVSVCTICYGNRFDSISSYPNGNSLDYPKATTTGSKIIATQ